MLLLTDQTGRAHRMTITTKTKLAFAAAMFALGLSGCTTANSNLAAIEPAAFNTEAADPADVVLPLSEEQELAAANVPVVEAASAADEQILTEDEAPQESLVASLMPNRQLTAAFSGGSRERNCLMRAMYFESNRSSREGQLAVGTVVMHRLASGNYARSVCGVVGQHRQFAPGVMSRRMQGDTTDLAKLADSILRGKRHPRLASNVMFFHQAGLRFPYRNMRYVLVAGGNTFYYKASRKRR
jgi:spore germination cell wall hydrolase CwlJ-like protein